VERLNHQQATKLTRQARDISILRAELVHLRQEQECREEAASQLSEVEHLTRQLAAACADRDRYRRQVEDMTKFLADYGMTWLGDHHHDGGEDEDASEEDNEGDWLNDVGIPQLAGDAQSVPSRTTSSRKSVAESLARPCERSDIEVNIAEIESRVCGLNAMVERAAQVVRDSRGGAVHARLVMDDAPPLPLSFFADGLKLGSHEFKPYHSKDAQQLIHDVLDGYFPYELKAGYPDGVCLRVVDRMSHAFHHWLRVYAAEDSELLDNGDRLLPPGARVVRGPNGRPPRCPTGGQSSQTAGKPRSTSMPPAVEAAPEVNLLDANRSPDLPSARLQVRLQGGRRLVLAMEASATIGALEDAVSRWCEEEGFQEGTAMAAGAPSGGNVVLRAAFPPRVFQDRNETLEGAGLVPSATLFASAFAAAAA